MNNQNNKGYFETIKNGFLYGSTTKEQFDSVRELREESNHKIWRIISIVLTLYFGCLYVSTFSVSVVQLNAYVDLLLMLLSLASFILLNTIAKPNTKLLTVVIYLMSAALLFFGITIGVVLSPEYIAVTFHVLLVCLPLVVSDKPHRMSILQIISVIAFIVLCLIYKDADTRDLDIYNAVAFAALAQFVVFFMNKSKTLQFIAERENRLNSITDIFTRLYNRNAYENDIAKLDKNISDQFAYITVDVDGLKLANDNYGHGAGDELLIGVANCMSECFNQFGDVYRIGGDEFVALLNAPRNEIEKAVTCFRNSISDWRGKYMSHLSVSVGYVFKCDYPSSSIYELAKKADKNMYEEKAVYYRENEAKTRA